jgi:hypothetical protein
VRNCGQAFCFCVALCSETSYYRSLGPKPWPGGSPDGQSRFLSVALIRASERWDIALNTPPPSVPIYKMPFVTTQSFSPETA